MEHLEWREARHRPSHKRVAYATTRAPSDQSGGKPDDRAMPHQADVGSARVHRAVGASGIVQGVSEYGSSGEVVVKGSPGG